MKAMGSGQVWHLPVGPRNVPRADELRGRSQLDAVRLPVASDLAMRLLVVNEKVPVAASNVLPVNEMPPPNGRHVPSERPDPARELSEAMQTSEFVKTFVMIVDAANARRNHRVAETPIATTQIGPPGLSEASGPIAMSVGLSAKHLRVVAMKRTSPPAIAMTGAVDLGVVPDEKSGRGRVLAVNVPRDAATATAPAPAEALKDHASRNLPGLPSAANVPQNPQMTRTTIARVERSRRLKSRPGNMRSLF